jgi:hypothetical protein
VQTAFLFFEVKMTLTQYRTRLTALNASYDNAIKTGANFAVTGSFSGANWPLEKLTREINDTRRMILRLSGNGARRTQPNFV